VSRYAGQAVTAEVACRRGNKACVAPSRQQVSRHSPGERSAGNPAISPRSTRRDRRLCVPVSRRVCPYIRTV